jgi:hypothetical protein
MTNGHQRQRHGVTKNLAEGIGGVLVGAAAVLVLRGWLGPRACRSPSTTAALTPEAMPQATPTPPIPAKPKRRPSPKRQPESTP